MPKLMEPPPHTPVEAVTEILHGVPVTDPYRWLEDQESFRTRAWLAAQAGYARSYLDAAPGRQRIRERIRQFLAVETYDSLQKVGSRYFFRKRLANQEQPCIYVREGADGEDQLLIDPAERETGVYTAVKPLRVSSNGRLLLYEIKEGGERTGVFELLDIETHKRLPDSLPRGYLRGFAFAPDDRGFYYVHEALDTRLRSRCAAYYHSLGTPSSQDQKIFVADEDSKIRLALLADESRLVFFVYRFEHQTLTDVYVKRFDLEHAPELIFEKVDYALGFYFLHDRIFVLTDKGAPNRRIVEIRSRPSEPSEWVDLIPEIDMRIESWFVIDNQIFVCYAKQTAHQIHVFDLSGNKMGEVPVPADGTIRAIGGSPNGDELLLETESFTEPVAILRYSTRIKELALFARKRTPFESANYGHSQVWFNSKDGTRIPMYLVGRRDVLDRADNPTVMTAYGGYGASMTPQFSVFVAFLMERGCLFALPNIRGGSEFGLEWHNAARRQNRQTGYDDFLCAAEWLLQTGRTSPGRLAIFGGSNSGLLVGVAMTQRPDLFRAVVCMGPILDMLRYHHFDDAHVWRDEFGLADDPEDFVALAKYSPYHRIHEGTCYPATMIVSGDADRNCNPLHARKMTARLQACNASDNVILLDYDVHRGHSAVLPLSSRITALTDRMAFLCDQLQLAV
jgi:prolyl oligopeptidase